MQTDTIRVTEIIMLDKADVRMTTDGYMTANPRVARIGIQLYAGKELGKPDMERVRVWRPEAEVMDKAALMTIAHRPITNDHPTTPVDAANWKKYAVGQTGDQVARDGEFVRVPMCLMDANAIKDYNDGKKELSLGYTSNLEWRSGTTPQGEQYDAVQTMIRVNHLAVVDAARGGPKLAIGDGISIDQLAVDEAKKLIADGKVERKAKFDPAATPVGKVLLLASVPSTGDKKYPFTVDGIVYRSALESIKAQAAAAQEQPIVMLCDQLVELIDKEKDTMSNDEKKTTIVVDGVSLEMSDIAGSVVLRRMKALESEANDLRTKLEADAAKTKKEQEALAALAEEAKKKASTDAATIVTLTKQLEDAKLTPQKLDELVKDRAQVVGRARVVLGDKLVVDGKTEADMRKQVVEAKLGDACKGWTDDQIKASFHTLTADVKDEQIVQGISATDAMRRSFSGQPAAHTVNDSEKRYDNYDKKLSDAWKQTAAAAS